MSVRRQDPPYGTLDDPDSLEKRISSSVEVLGTEGSEQNFKKLVEGEADLAIIQGGSVPIEEVSVITPLFREFVFVIARKGTDIQSVWDLKGSSWWILSFGT
jgi:TRAP-type uncharacterized transport system substrate-binding protein